MLPECVYRVELTTPGKFYCRHTQVHARDSIVTSQFCSSCTSRTMSCSHPRPIPANRDAPVTTEPTLFQMAWNASASIAAFVADGMQFVDKETYAARLAVCDTCDQRSGTQCLNCGCMLALKAAGRAFACPLGKWNNVSSRSESEETS
jgi:hypothetical protein